jgi:hypothetical protein
MESEIQRQRRRSARASRDLPVTGEGDDIVDLLNTMQGVGRPTDPVLRRLSCVPGARLSARLDTRMDTRSHLSPLHDLGIIDEREIDVR